MGRKSGKKSLANNNKDKDSSLEAMEELMSCLALDDEQLKRTKQGRVGKKSSKEKESKKNRVRLRPSKLDAVVLQHCSCPSDLSLESASLPSLQSSTSLVALSSSCESRPARYRCGRGKRRRKARRERRLEERKKKESKKETAKNEATCSTSKPTSVIVSSDMSCSDEARQCTVSVADLAGYLEDSVVFPRKMSYMAEMMYT